MRKYQALELLSMEGKVLKPPYYTDEANKHYAVIITDSNDVKHFFKLDMYGQLFYDGWDAPATSENLDKEWRAKK